MVLTLVLVPALADALGGCHLDPHAAGASGGGGILVTLAITLLKVAAFIGLATVLGPKAVPWLLKQAARTGSRELFTLSVLALALGIAYGSAQVFGVSFALGAFFAGMVLNGTDFSHRAAADSLPLQDAFAILFQQTLHVLAAIVLGKSLAALAMVLALG
jgi:monovalent cation:H+ antiporter-2, CPA2 family